MKPKSYLIKLFIIQLMSIRRIQLKIYHTEKQADYDALMVELGAEGVIRQDGLRPTVISSWWVFRSKTCNLVDKGILSQRRIDYCYYYHRSTPIIKYKAKTDEKIARRNKVCIAEEN